MVHSSSFVVNIENPDPSTLLRTGPSRANQKAFLMAGDSQIHVSHHGERGTRREKGV
jgi:hypothetical protein